MESSFFVQCEISKNSYNIWFYHDFDWYYLAQNKLTILTLKTAFYLIQYIQRSIEIETWLLLTFFLCLHDQSTSIHSIVTHIKENRCLKNCDSSNTQTWMVASFSTSGRFTAKFQSVFVLTQEKKYLIFSFNYPLINFFLYFERKAYLAYFAVTIYTLFWSNLCIHKVKLLLFCLYSHLS